MSMPSVGVVSNKDKERISKTVRSTSKDVKGRVFVFSLLFALAITLLILVVLLVQVLVDGWPILSDDPWAFVTGTLRSRSDDPLLGVSQGLYGSFWIAMFVAALGVVFSRNPINAVMFLVFTFFNAAILWLLAEAEFLAIVLVLVYVGAVMVLFLFVVMMLEVDIEAAKRGLTRYAPLGIGLSFVMAIELINVIWLRGKLSNEAGGFAPTPEGYSNTEALGAVLYTEHVFAFEVAAVILLLAIIAAITLTMRKRPGLKVQNIAKQVAVRAKDRIRVVKMDAEKKQ